MKASDANKLRSNIQRVLRGIGHTNGTRLPPTKLNSGQIALQYWLMSFCATMISGMLREATQDALKAGVIFNHKEAPEPEGTQRQVYSSDAVSVNLIVNKASMSLDQEVLKANLRKLKLTQEQIDNAFANSMKHNAAPHKFTAMLIEQQD